MDRMIDNELELAWEQSQKLWERVYDKIEDSKMELLLKRAGVVFENLSDLKIIAQILETRMSQVWPKKRPDKPARRVRKKLMKVKETI